jgi:transketolase
MPTAAPVSIQPASCAAGMRMVRTDSAVIGLERFGRSGPGNEVYAAHDFAVDRAVNRARTLL